MYECMYVCNDRVYDDEDVYINIYILEYLN